MKHFKIIAGKPLYTLSLNAALCTHLINLNYFNFILKLQELIFNKVYMVTTLPFFAETQSVIILFIKIRHFRRGLRLECGKSLVQSSLKTILPMRTTYLPNDQQVLMATRGLYYGPYHLYLCKFSVDLYMIV